MEKALSQKHFSQPAMKWICECLCLPQYIIYYELSTDDIMVKRNRERAPQSIENIGIHVIDPTGFSGRFRRIFRRNSAVFSGGICRILPDNPAVRRNSAVFSGRIIRRNSAVFAGCIFRRNSAVFSGYPADFSGRILPYFAPKMGIA